MSTGRPKEDLSTMPESWYNEVLGIYAQGGADIEIKALIFNWRGSFSNDLWDRWINEEPEFSETIKKGRMLSEAWWVRNGRTNLKDKDFNYTGWYMQMKNRFGWADKTENKNENTNINSKELTPDEIKALNEELNKTY